MSKRTIEQDTPETKVVPKKEKKSQIVVQEDGDVEYFDGWLSSQDATDLFEQLSQLKWQSDTVSLFGKTFTPSRKIYSFGDTGISYRYSGSTKEGSGEWHPALADLKKKLEDTTGQQFNFALLNYYPNGNSHIGFHADNEKGLKRDGIIASLSLGVERRFVFKYNKDTSKKVELKLANGSLLLMKGETQRNWKHSLPKATRITSPRINVTFRCIE